jgi:hypothetical protein
VPKMPKVKATKHDSTIKSMGILYTYDLVISYFFSTQLAARR